MIHKRCHFLPPTVAMATQRHAGFQLERKSGRGQSVHKVKHESMKAVASRFKDLTPLNWICIAEIRNSIPPSQKQRFRSP